MAIFKIAFIGVLMLALFGGAAAHWQYRRAMNAAEAARADLLAGRPAPTAWFDIGMLDGQPEIARRYFSHAIAPGTPLQTTVALTMRGRFLLGDAAESRAFEMEAEQVLAAPTEFVWLAHMRSGPFLVSGSDMLVDGHAAMRFWGFGAVPLANESDTEDLNRSAVARPALEAIWAPAALLPSDEVEWLQTGPDTALVRFAGGMEPFAMNMVLGPDGAVRAVWGMRWSDANADRVFRLQEFGGEIDAEGEFGGYTIPTQVRVGNLYGTPAFFPFFQARITAARYE